MKQENIPDFKTIKYTEILKFNSELDSSSFEKKVNIKILSNITIHQLKDVLEYKLKSSGIDVNTSLGNYDNILQDCLNVPPNNIVFIFLEFSNIIEGFQHKVEILTKEERDSFEEKIKSEIVLIFDNLKESKLVLMNSFSATPFTFMSNEGFIADDFCARINTFIRSNMPENFRIINIDKIFASCGVKSCIDYRYFLSSKALYSIGFLKGYVELVLPYINTISGEFKKVLMLDCDNTLWKGIIGEDGVNGIEIGEVNASSKAFYEVQTLFKKLKNEGVVLNICSKNNVNDVEQVFRENSGMVLKEEDFLYKEIHWKDKVSSIQNITKKINVGLSSVAFVDDSSFEIDFVRQKLPEVVTYQVPNKIFNYPFFVRGIVNDFYSMNQTKEDQLKNTLYTAEKRRKETAENHNGINEYLLSLGLKLDISIDALGEINRLSQLTQKTNQFNLSTKRYSESEVTGFIKGENYRVYSFCLTDKFGDYGVTGMAILKIDLLKCESFIDTFLMSCRVIGRTVEDTFFQYIIKDMFEIGVTDVFSSYIKTTKNSLGKDFYDKMGMETILLEDNKKHYKLKMLKKPLLKKENIVEVTN
jgi:FkbH-like protein